MRNTIIDKYSGSDIMGANNTFYYDDYDDTVCRAAGDIIESCSLDLPYDNQRIQMLRDRVSVSNNTLAVAKAEDQKAYKAWQNCRDRLFCHARPKKNILDRKRAQKAIAIEAYDAAKADLAQANTVNDAAEENFDECKYSVILLSDKNLYGNKQSPAITRYH